MAGIISKSFTKSLEDIKHISNEGIEYWSARELYPLLGYQKWQKFTDALNRARHTCKNSGEDENNHFIGAGKMEKIGLGKEREVSDVHLSRYACYLVTLNGDPRKKEIALAQTYFAIQTRKQEILESMSDDQKRLFIRQEIVNNNKKLMSTAKDAGVIYFGRFNNAGYMGLYGGLTIKQIEKKKGISKGKLLDRSGTTELAANLFRITQADEKIRNEEIKGQIKAEKAHREVGEKVRKTIREIGGTMPENLPVEEDIKSIERKISKSKKFSSNKKEI